MSFTSNMSRFGSAFDVNVSYIVSDSFYDFKSFLIFFLTIQFGLMFTLMLTIN